MDLRIPQLPDNYVPQAPEVFTRDDQLVSYGIWYHRCYPRGYRVKEGGVQWLVTEDSRWQYIVREWNGIRPWLQQHSETVASLKRYAREQRGY